MTALTDEEARLLALVATEIDPQRLAQALKELCDLLREREERELRKAAQA
jgi:hypothetical protein